MNQNNKNISEEEIIEIAKSAFARFKIKISKLFKRQNDLFARIMSRITNRKLEEQRKKLDELYKDN